MLTLSWSSISSANSSAGATWMLMEHKDAQGQIVFTSRAWRRLFDIRGPLVHELILEFFSTFRLIACSIAERSPAPKKVMVTDLFYLRGMDINSVNVPYLLARYLRLFASGRKSGALILGGKFVARLDEHFGLLTEERLLGLTIISPTLPIINMDKLVRMRMEHRDAQGQIVFTSRAWRFSEAVLELDTDGDLKFRLGGVRRRMSWREFILALGLHTVEEMQTAGFSLYWADSIWQMPDKGDLKRQQVAAAGALEATEDVHAVDEGAQAVPATIHAP
nr:hypothetical protein [Tanacetum cinerariifolium]